MGGLFDRPIFNPNPILASPVTGHPWDDQLAPMRHGTEQHAPVHGVVPGDYNSYQEYQDALAREAGIQASEAARRVGTTTAGTRAASTASPPAPPALRRQTAAEGRERVGQFVSTARRKSIPPATGFWFDSRKTLFGNSVLREHSLGVRGWMIDGLNIVLTDGRLVQRLGCRRNQRRLIGYNGPRLVSSEGAVLLELHRTLIFRPFEDAPSEMALTAAIAKCQEVNSGAWNYR